MSLSLEFELPAPSLVSAHRRLHQGRDPEGTQGWSLHFSAVLSSLELSQNYARRYLCRPQEHNFLAEGNKCGSAVTRPSPGSAVPAAQPRAPRRLTLSGALWPTRAAELVGLAAAWYLCPTRSKPGSPRFVFFFSRK